MNGYAFYPYQSFPDTKPHLKKPGSAKSLTVLQAIYENYQRIRAGQCAFASVATGIQLA